MEEAKEELKHIGRIKLITGLTLWQLTDTNEVEKAEIEVHIVDDHKGGVLEKKSVIVKKGYRYCVALNLKNAKRKFGV